MFNIYTAKYNKQSLENSILKQTYLMVCWIFIVTVAYNIYRENFNMLFIDQMKPILFIEENFKLCYIILKAQFLLMDKNRQFLPACGFNR